MIKYEYTYTLYTLCSVSPWKDLVWCPLDWIPLYSMSIFHNRVSPKAFEVRFCNFFCALGYQLMIWYRIRNPLSSVNGISPLETIDILASGKVPEFKPWRRGLGWLPCRILRTLNASRRCHRLWLCWLSGHGKIPTSPLNRPSWQPCSRSPQLTGTWGSFNLARKTCIAFLSPGCASWASVRGRAISRCEGRLWHSWREALSETPDGLCGACLSVSSSLGSWALSWSGRSEWWDEANQFTSFPCCHVFSYCFRRVVVSSRSRIS